MMNMDNEPTREQLIEALKQCVILSGADLSGGFPTWPPLHELAVQEVKQLRDDYDDALDQIDLSIPKK